MLDQFKNLKNLSSLMGNSEEIQAKIDQLQSELAKKTAEADAGAGAVRVVVSGKMEIKQVELDPSMIQTLTGEGAEDDKAMIEELILSATNEAMRRAQQLAKQEMSQMAGGMNLPGLDQLLGSN